MNIESHVMQWVAIYSIIALLICGRLLYYASNKYDWADWQFNRNQILNRIMRRVFLWPFFLVAPKQLIKPAFDFKHGEFCGEDGAELARKRTDFMDNPPPCGSTISFSGEHGWSSIKGEFLFPASIAHEFAVRKWRGDRTLPGIRGAIWWLGLRDGTLGEKTPVPELLPNFDRVAHDMIDAGVGQVRCPECNKIYMASEIVSETSNIGSGGCCQTAWRFLNCPEKHVLMSYEYMRLYLKRPACDSDHESECAKELAIPKFTAGLE